DLLYACLALENDKLRDKVERKFRRILHVDTDTVLDRRDLAWDRRAAPDEPMGIRSRASTSHLPASLVGPRLAYVGHIPRRRLNAVRRRRGVFSAEYVFTCWANRNPVGTNTVICAIMRNTADDKEPSDVDDQLERAGLADIYRLWALLCARARAADRGVL